MLRNVALLAILLWIQGTSIHGALGKTEMVQRREKCLFVRPPCSQCNWGRSIFSPGLRIGRPNQRHLILDNSGSMELVTGRRTRFTGARMFLSLLDAATPRIILFSTDSVLLTDGLVTIEHEMTKLRYSSKSRNGPRCLRMSGRHFFL